MVWKWTRRYAASRGYHSYLTWRFPTFYLLYVTRTVHTLIRKFWKNYDYLCHPAQEVIAGNYLEKANRDMVQTKYYLETLVALILSFSIIGLCPDLHETSIYVKPKIISLEKDWKSCVVHLKRPLLAQFSC